MLSSKTDTTKPKAVTKTAIARELNVSRSTVTAVLCNLPSARISPEVRQKVLDAAERLNYRPNRYAQIMRNGKSGVIGVINLSSSSYLALDKVRTASRYLIEKGYEPLVQEPLWFREVGGDEGKSACERLLDMRAEGVILSHPSELFAPEYIEPFLQAGIPVVSIGGGAHLKGIPCFISDREWGYYTLVRHLLSIGHRHLAIVTDSHNIIKRAAQKALKEFPNRHRVRIQFLPDEAKDLSKPYSVVLFSSGKAIMEKLLKAKDRPSVVMLRNDEQALGALTACGEQGISVPDEMALVGFDNFPPAEYGYVPITTIAQPIRALAHQAVDCMLEAIRTGTLPEPQQIKIKGELIIRGSCGASRHLATPPLS